MFLTNVAPYFFSLNLLLLSFLTTKNKIRVLQQNHVLIKVTMSIFLHFSPYLTLPTSNILVRVTQVLLIFEFILHLSSRYSCSIAFRFKLGSVCIEFDVESFFIHRTSVRVDRDVALAVLSSFY